MSLAVLDKRGRTIVASAAAFALIMYIRKKNQKPPPKPIEYSVAARPETEPDGKTSYLITGGAGMLGGHIMSQLRERYPDARLYSLDLGVPQPSKRVVGATYIRCDLSNPGHMEQAFNEAKTDGGVIESVLHIAAVLPQAGTTWPVFEKVNIKGTALLVEKSLEKGAAAFIYCSSATAVLNLDNPMMDGVKGENLPYPTNYVDLYGKSKALGEMEVLKRNGKVNASGNPMVTTSLRVSGIVDANDRAFGQNLPRGFNNVFFGSGANVIDWVWSIDVARCFVAATRAAVKRPEVVGGKPFHIGGFTRGISFKEWISYPDPENPGQTLWGNRYPAVSIPGWLIRSAGVLNLWGVKVLGFPPIDPMLRPDTVRVTDGTLSWWWDLSATKEAFGYEPTPVEEVIRNVRDENMGLMQRGEAFERRGRLPTI